MKNNGFTLSEVLITLVIIGVIAAMTVPTVMNNSAKQEAVSQLKKAYSILQQSTYKMAQNNGYAPGDYSFIKDLNFIDEFAKTAHVVKKCTKMKDCMGSQSIYKYLDNNTVNGLSDGKALILADGIMLTFNSTNLTHGLSTQDNSNSLGRILVDVNGKKKPNQYGRDVFFFYLIKDKGVVPAGSGNNSADCKKNQKGITCAAKVLKEGKIDY